MANPLNNSFESWSVPGTAGSSNGTCDNWTTVSVVGGTATRSSTAYSGTYSLDLRGSSSAKYYDVGAIKSDAFALTNDYITFYKRDEVSSAFITITVAILNESDVTIRHLNVSAYTAGWKKYCLYVGDLKGQNIKILFEQHVSASTFGMGYYTLIDLVEGTDTPSGEAIEEPRLLEEAAQQVSNTINIDNLSPAPFLLATAETYGEMWKALDKLSASGEAWIPAPAPSVGSPHWLKYEYMYPFGTSLCSGGTATADTTEGTNYPANAFDGNETSTMWSSTETALPHWIKYDFGSGNETVVNSYSIVARFDYPLRTPKTFIFQGSNNDVDWTNLDTVTNAEWAQSTQKEYFCNFSEGENTTAYRYYRIYATASGDSTWSQITEIGMYNITIADLPSRAIKRFQTKNRVSAFVNSPRDYKIQGSNNGVVWTDLVSVTADGDNASGSLKTFDITTPLPFRIYRFVTTARNGGDAYVALGEWTFYSIYNSIAFDGTATASGSEGANTPNLAIDSIDGTKWEQLHTDSKAASWFKLDLGSMVHIDRILLRTGSNNLGYDISVSEDDASYTPIITGYSQVEVAEYVDLNSDGRYIKIHNFTGSETYAQIYELLVYASTYVPGDIFKNTQQDIRFVQEVIEDADQDIRFKHIEAIEDLLQDVRYSTEIALAKDLPQDVRIAKDFIEAYRHAVQDIRFNKIQVDDISEDIRFILYYVAYKDLNQDIRFVTQEIKDISLDIRTIKTSLNDLGEDVRFHIRVISDFLNNVAFDKVYYKDFYGNTVIEKDGEVNFYGYTTIVQPASLVPTGLTATDMLKGDLIKLTWDADANYAYNLYTTAPGIRTKLNNYPIVGSTEFLVGNLVEDTTYTFVAVGVNGIGVESADSTSTTGTPTFPDFAGGASRFMSYTTEVKINSITRSDIILANVELGYGTSPATARFTIPKDPDTAGLPALDDEVEVIVNSRSIFKGIIKNIEKSLSSSGMACSYIAYSHLIDYNGSSVDWAYIQSIKSQYGIDVTDQTWLQAYETVANFVGNYRLYYNMTTDVIDWYQLGTGFWNRSVTIGQNVLEWNITEDIINKVTLVTVRGARKRIVTDWLPLSWSQRTIQSTDSQTTDAVVYYAEIEAFNIGDIQVEAYQSLGQVEYDYDKKKSIVPSDVYTLSSLRGSQKKTEWIDGTTGSKQVVYNWRSPKKEWRSSGVNVEYVYERIGNEDIPVKAILTSTDDPRTFGALIGFGYARREGRVPSEDIDFGYVHWADGVVSSRSAFRYSYSYEEDLPVVVNTGSGDPSRTITDTQYLVLKDNLNGEDTETYVLNQMNTRAVDELSKLNVPNINGRVKILGDETFDLKTRVNINGQLLDVIRVSHDFSNGFTTDIELTNERFRINIPPYQEQRRKVDYERKITGTQSYLQRVQRQISQLTSTRTSKQDPAQDIPKSPYAIYGD